MQKILFNDKYGLTQAVLEGRKTQTRRVLNPTMFFQRLETFEGWSKEDIGAWKRSCKRRFYEAQGDILQQMLDYALSSSRYKVGEEVAIAQPYRMTACKVNYNEKEIKEVVSSIGWKNKMYVKANIMPHRIRITDIRIERLQEISDEDCIAEGIKKNPEVLRDMWEFSYIKGVTLKFEMSTTPRGAYAKLIDHISGKGTWESNPYVFVYEFELIK
nr:MAG TPA: ASCH domain protein [Caudoviricetes sp.]DAQ40675.1 MAG TPA: ASCH domain protein [Caudoviricetes sp.]